MKARKTKKVKCEMCCKERIVRSDSISRFCKPCYNSLSNPKHGMTNTRLYRIWNAMRTRCNKKYDSHYNSYGGRGIKVCKQWDDDFIVFYKWAIENGYSNNLSIDRINNDGNYNPSNCRWANQQVQTRNTKRIWATNKSGYRGVSRTPKSKTWRAQITVNKKAIHLGTYKEKIDAAKAFDKYVLDNNLEHTINNA